jgi:hypothetical protein
VISDQRRLLAEMGKSAGDHGFCASITVTELTVQAIDSTLPRAKPAFPQKFFQTPDPVLEISLFIETDIGRGRSQFKITPSEDSYLLIINYHKKLGNSMPAPRGQKVSLWVNWSFGCGFASKGRLDW